MNLYQFIVYLLEHQDDLTVFGVFCMFLIAVLGIANFLEQTAKSLKRRKE